MPCHANVVYPFADVDLLDGSNWLNDQLIAFYLEYLRQEAFVDAKDKLLMLDPSTAFMLTAAAPEEVPMLLGCLQAPEKQMVHFFPHLPSCLLCLRLVQLM